MSENQLQVVDSPQTITAPREVPLDHLPMEKRLERGREMARVLGQVITDCGFTTKIGRSKHVNAEGWQMLTQSVGVTGQKVTAWTDPEGNSRARCEYFINGELVASGESMVGINEELWCDREQFAREAMAQTRAMGRAARMKWAWIMELAGFSGTPSEEMIDEKTAKKSKPAKSTQSAQPPKEPAGIGEDHVGHLLQLIESSHTAEELETARTALTHAKPQMNPKELQGLTNAFAARKSAIDTPTGF